MRLPKCGSLQTNMPTSSKATQEFVPIKEVRDGIMILKDGSMRGIVLASSLNFSLKSDDERNAILLQFQDFLNSLDFSVEILVQSRKLDIRPYLALLEEQMSVVEQGLVRTGIRVARLGTEEVIELFYKAFNPGETEKPIKMK